MKNNIRDGIFESLPGKDLKKARSAINRIRKEGKLEDIPEIINAFRMQEQEIIHKEIYRLLCDIQLEGSAFLLIEAIMDPQNEKILHELLSICWESKQDFTEYLNTFVSIFLKSDYRASLEAFTIIEKIFLDYDIPKNKLQTTIEVIKTSYPDLIQDKKELAHILLDALNNQKG